jgi:phospholipase C
MTFMRLVRAVTAAGAALIACGCSSSPSPGETSKSADAGSDVPQKTTCSGVCPATNIEHLVVIVQENHTFDNHFGAYCTAPAGSNPTCNTGPSCCEAMPATDPMGVAPQTITDTVLGGRDPDHTQACEMAEMDDGKMDMYSNAPSCGDVGNIALSDPTIVEPYWDYASKYAIADRYFQPIIGQSSSNDMYFARASYVFTDNDAAPAGAIGMTCDVESTAAQYSDTTIGDLLNAKGVPWSVYAGGYAAMATAVATSTCPAITTGCPANLPFYPCLFDPSDIPFEYYPTLRDVPANMRDLGMLTSDLAAGTLPAVVFVKGIGFDSEHPGLRDELSEGVAWATSVVSAIEASSVANETLVLITYDEGGGYFDHVTPPPPNPADNQPYGTRVPLIAIGPFAKKNYVSHVVMEHSSIVKFIEYNWLGATGQLGTRDTNVNDIGDLLDPTATGGTVP